MFKKWRIQTSLVEVPLTGPHFTWTNNQLDNCLILERLDRAYCTNEWDYLHPNGILLHEPIFISNHAAIVYDSNDIKAGNKIPYQIEN